jgi:hypothetical protein
LRFRVKHDTCIVLPPDASLPDAEPDEGQWEPRSKDIIALDFTPDEQPYAAWISREIETTFDHERMPPEVGKVIVPDVATGVRWSGQATISDCLMSDDL